MGKDVAPRNPEFDIQESGRLAETEKGRGVSDEALADIGYATPDVPDGTFRNPFAFRTELDGYRPADTESSKDDDQQDDSGVSGGDLPSNDEDEDT
jgi:hypothetical protein